MIAVVPPNPGSRVRFLDPDKARVARGVTLDDTAAIENVLRWVD